MSESRATILATIRQQLGRGAETGTALAEIHDRLQAGKANLIPQRGQLTGSARLEMFVKMAHHVKATTALVTHESELAGAIEAWVSARGLPKMLSVSHDIQALAAPLNAAGFTLTEAIPEPDGGVVLTGCFAGVAESGTLVVCCEKGHPHTLNILAQQHIVILPIARLAANYEESWGWLQAERGMVLPRALLWITGPSRTGDIEQTMQLGAHGPKALHIILYGETS